MSLCVTFHGVASAHGLWFAIFVSIHMPPAQNGSFYCPADAALDLPNNSLVGKASALRDFTQGWMKEQFSSLANVFWKVEQTKVVKCGPVLTKRLVVVGKRCFSELYIILWVPLKYYISYLQSFIEWKSISLILLQDRFLFELEMIFKYPLNCTASV